MEPFHYQAEMHSFNLLIIYLWLSLKGHWRNWLGKSARIEKKSFRVHPWQTGRVTNHPSLLKARKFPRMWDFSMLKLLEPRATPGCHWKMTWGAKIYSYCFLVHSVFLLKTLLEHSKLFLLCYKEWNFLQFFSQQSREVKRLRRLGGVAASGNP